MPDSYLHRRLALGLLQRLQPEAVSAAEAALPAYEVGALGPDPLFAHGFTRPLGHDAVRELGGRLHHEFTGAFFAALLQEACGNALLQAYALGFLCHYAADSTIHPYVYAVTGEHDDKPAPGAHGVLESAIDGLYYRSDAPNARRVPPPPATLLKMTQEARLAIGGAVAAAARASHGATASARDIAQSLADMAFLSRLQYSPHGGKYALAAFVERLARRPGSLTGHFVRPQPPEEDVLNDTHAPWASPWEPHRVRHESVRELYDQAGEFAEACVEQATRFFRGERTLADALQTIDNRNMASGLDCATPHA